MSYFFASTPTPQDSGMVMLTSNTSGSGANSTVGSAVLAPGMSFTPLYSSDYFVHLRLHCNITVGGNGVIVFLDAAGGSSAAIVGSESLIALPTGTGEFSGGGTMRVTLVSGTQYDTRFFNPAGSSGFSLITNANVRSSLTWSKV